ncbi:dienelactone hydrolase family protein [Fimbriiglobus ruber]|uniref:Dienelactone hydrolase family n=1 Tax=Fimbriiglobus ruber TaxID=1908690 RepID=A0A225DF85_9BACT|nr:dienelactone hydrolase family protein [Fimbriiglobus ruber]OWK40210.1 Dienelactone hydrolase family [Fimbriiglobus ruber]
MRLALSACLLGLLAAPAVAQDWAKAKLEKSLRHGEWVKVKSGAREVQTFVVYPEVKEKATAVVVIHEIFGLTDWVRLVADQLAADGYIAIAPDLLTGAGPNGGGTDSLGSGDGVRKAIMSLPPDQITADLNASVDYATKLPACNGKVAAGGFCWGGGQAFRFATNNKAIKAAFAFYGTGPDKESDIARIQAPVYGFYGGNDARVNATIPKSTDLMKKAEKTYDPVTYEGAGHGFMRAGAAPDTNEANKKAMTEAWKRWNELLKKL